MELRSTFEGPSEIPASCPPCSICAATGIFCQDILLLDRECKLMALCDRRRGFFSGGLASLGGEVLQTRAHLGRRLAIQKVQQPQLFTDGVALLESEDDPGVLPPAEIQCVWSKLKSLMLKLYNTRPSLAARRRWSSSLLPIIPQSKAVRTSMRRARRFFCSFSVHGFRSFTFWFHFEIGLARPPMSQDVASAYQTIRSRP
jgi:hypothetical protein